MKAIHKRQVQVIMLLSAVILILLCGVLVTLSRQKKEAATPTAQETPYVHKLVRDARPSLNPSLEYETTLGGSGDEVPIALLHKNGKVYVFGNTTSFDYDFAGVQEGATVGFCAVLEENGRTESFSTFPFTLAKVIPTVSGFAAAGNRGSVAGLYLLSDALTVTGEASMPSATALSACALYVFDNRYFLFAESREETAERVSLLLHVYTAGLSLERSKVFSHTYSLHLLELLPAEGGYLLAAAASFQGRSYLSLARFDLLSEPAFSDVDLGYPYTPQSFVPTESGYACVCARNQKTELLTLTPSLKKDHVCFLSEQETPGNKALFFAGALYAHTGTELLQIDASGKTLGAHPFAAQSICDYLSGSVAATVAAFDSDGNLALAFLASTSATKTLPVQGTDARLAQAGTRLLVACAATSVKDDPHPFGGKDVWIGSVQL